MSTPAAALTIGDEKFVSLSTFRKSGEAVSTPVWIAREGENLIFTTPADTGKVKRVRAGSRVEIRPSSRMGKVADGARLAEGRAEIISDEAEVARLSTIFATKYGFEYRLFMFIESLGKAGTKRRVILRVTPS